jgi:predicted phosphoserine aminotransferase
MSETGGDRADSFGRFFLPGPTEVRPEILAAQTGEMIGHRGPAVQRLMASLQDGLKAIFGTSRPVFLSTSSATGLMEAAIRNGARARALCLVNGAFSGRFATIARACGVDVDVLEAPWGRAHDPDDLAEALSRNRYDVVTVVHSETSTGVLNPLDDLAPVVLARDDTLLLVDSVTGAGGVPVEADARGLDFVLTGSQKAMALPPGLSFGVASERMMDRSASLPGRGFYFDFQRFQDQLDRLQTPTTPALSLMYALEAQLRHMAAEGLERRFRRHAEMAEVCWSWVGETSNRLGVPMSVLAPEGSRSPTVTCIEMPAGAQPSAVVAGMKERGFVIGGGYGKLKDTTIRIGHMGDHTVKELEVVLGVLQEVIEEQ